MNVNSELKSVAFQFCGSGDMRGGVQDSINTFAGYLDGQGVQTEVLVGSIGNTWIAEQTFDNIAPDSIHTLGGKSRFLVANGSQNPIGSIVRPKQAAAVLKEINPDILHITAPWVPYIGGVVLREAQKADIPTVATYHVYSQEPKTNRAVWLAGFVDRKPRKGLDAMIAVSMAAREHVWRYFGHMGDVHIIPNGVDVVRYEQAQAFKADEPFSGFSPERSTLVFVGRPDERKGLDTLLDAFSQLKDRSAEETASSQLVICGDGPSKPKFQAYARQLGIEGSCHFVGRVSDGTKARWLKTADLAVFPAKGGESQGIVLLEAMAAGSGAVLGGNNRGYRGVLADLPNGNQGLFDPNDGRQLASLMYWLLNDQTARSELHNEQRQLVRKRYDIAAVGKQITNLYAQLLNSSQL